MNVLSNFFIKIFGDNSQLKKAIDESKDMLEDQAKSTRRSGDAMNEASERQRQALAKKAQAAQRVDAAFDGLKNQLQSLAGINIDSILRFGSVVGLIAGVGALTKKFMSLHDEMHNIEERFKSLGLEGRENTRMLFENAEKLANQYGMVASEVRKISLSALTKGIDPTRANEMTHSAVAMSAAFGVSASTAERFVEQLEAGNYHMAARLSPELRRLIQMGADRQRIEGFINDKLAMGTTLAKDRMNTFTGLFDRLRNAYENMGDSLARALGPALQPVIKGLTETVEKYTLKISKWIDTNKEAFGSAVRLGGGLLLAWIGFSRLGYVTGLVSGALNTLLPGLNLVTGAFGRLFNLGSGGALQSGLGLLRQGIVGLVGSIGPVVSAIMSGLGQAVMSLVGIVLNPLRLVSMAVAGIGGAFRLATMGVRLFSLGIKGLMMATGIGLLIGLAASILGLADTFGETGNEAKSFVEIVQGAFAGLSGFIAPIWKWLQVEGMIVVKALAAAWHELSRMLMDLWGLLKSAWDSTMKFFRKIFGPVMDWFQSVFGETFSSISNLWAEFTAELTVIGLRMKQIGLIVVIALASIPTVIKWVWSSFAAFADWLSKNWVQVLVDGFWTVVSAIKLIGNVIYDISQAIISWFSNPTGGISFNFQSTQAAFEGLKNQATKVFAGLELPALDLSQVAPGLKAQLSSVSQQIADTKRAAKAAQEKDRRDAHDRQGKSKEEAARSPKLKIGGMDKAHFSDVTSFWKKLQEAAAGQRQEQVQKDQLEAMREINETLRRIEERKADVVPGGVVPR